MAARATRDEGPRCASHRLANSPFPTHNPSRQVLLFSYFTPEETGISGTFLRFHCWDVVEGDVHQLGGARLPWMLTPLATSTSGPSFVVSSLLGYLPLRVTWSRFSGAGLCPMMSLLEIGGERPQRAGWQQRPHKSSAQRPVDSRALPFPPWLLLTPSPIKMHSIPSPIKGPFNQAHTLPLSTRA